MYVRFHSHHGSNIVLSEDNTVASRRGSFAHALSFSEKPLLPGELFLIEITETERRWSGHMRLGLTLVDPTASLGSLTLPQYSLPDLAISSNSWIFSVVKAPPNALVVLMNRVLSPPDLQPKRSAIGDTLGLKTPRGCITKTILKPIENKDMPRNAFTLPMEIGSRIGVLFVPCVNGSVEEPDMAEMHFIINGVDQGPCTKNIPYTRGNLHAVVDVYGTTKQVQIIQLYGMKTLQMACRDTILAHITSGSAKLLPLPSDLIDFILTEDPTH